MLVTLITWKVVGLPILTVLCLIASMVTKIVCSVHEICHLKQQHMLHRFINSFFWNLLLSNLKQMSRCNFTNLFFWHEVLLDLQYYYCDDLTGGSIILWCQPAQVSLGGAVWQTSRGYSFMLGRNLDPNFSWSWSWPQSQWRWRSLRTTFAQKTRHSLSALIIF